MELATIFPSKYIKASDLQGHEPTVVIGDAKIEKLGDDQKLVLYFQGKEKGLVCNRTNADRIAHLYGSNTDEWIGKEITLYTEMVNFQGKVADAIRVKAPRKNGGYTITTGKDAKPVRTVAADPPSDEIPF